MNSEFKNEWGTAEFFNTLCGINGGHPVMVKDSLCYESSKWAPHPNRAYEFPVQRKLLKNECVLDFDDVYDASAEIILNYLRSTGLKFNAWRSSDTGVHIHFFANVSGKYHKIQLVEIVASRLYELFGVKNDINPMRHEIIRCEYSMHPQKKRKKLPMWCGINPVFPDNIFPQEILNTIEKNVPPLDENGYPIVKNAPKSLDNPPKCIKYIMTNRFVDGRKRLLFVLASWFKNLVPDEEILEILKEWSTKQGMSIPTYKIRTTIKSTNGTAGCKYRHYVLEELGHDPRCKN